MLYKISATVKEPIWVFGLFGIFIELPLLTLLEAVSVPRAEGKPHRFSGLELPLIRSLNQIKYYIIVRPKVDRELANFVCYT